MEKPTSEPQDGAAPREASAAELLTRWRAAERETEVAAAAASVAARAVASAQFAEEAAAHTDVAANAAMAAATRARDAAVLSKQAAGQAAAAAEELTVSAQAELANTDEQRAGAARVEEQARDDFHAAQSKGFPSSSR